MFLKAGLARRFSLEELHKKFNHRLNAIWNAFQTDFPSPTLTEFNRLIADLARFEDIRYPDKLLKHGVEIRIDYRAAPTPKGRSSRPEPVYRLDFYEMDRLIGAIFAVSSLNPFFFTTGLKPDVQEMLRRDNPAAAQLLPPR
jgi:hypothetical protein